MRQANFRRFFGKSVIQALNNTQVIVLGTDQKLWMDRAPFGKVPPPRQQIDASVVAFDTSLKNNIYVLGSDGKLWLEYGPFDGSVPTTVPPAREQVDATVAAFESFNDNLVLVLGQDGNLWLEEGPWGKVPPARQQVDGSVAAFLSINAGLILVLGQDGKLWLEQAPFGKVPPSRQQVDANVAAFDPIDANTIFVLGQDGNLWLEEGPFTGNVPPPRKQVDANVAAFAAVDANNIYVLGQDGNLWLEQAPFGKVPPSRKQVDGKVVAFDQWSSTSTIYVLGSDGKLWLEQAPFGSVPPQRQLVDQLGLPPSLTWSGSVGFGSGPTNANCNYKLTMSSNGEVQFSGTYNDTGSIPVLTSPSQDWNVVVAIPVAGRVLKFTASGTTPSANSSTWNGTSQNAEVALLWPLIVGATSTFKVSNSSDLGSIWSDIVTAFQDVGIIVGAIVAVMTLAGKVTGGSKPSPPPPSGKT
jgi:hypothetical protein